MQGIFKDMNSIYKVLNIGLPVLQVITVLSFVSRVLKNDMKILLLVEFGEGVNGGWYKKLRLLI